MPPIWCPERFKKPMRLPALGSKFRTARPSKPKAFHCPIPRAHTFTEPARLSRNPSTGLSQCVPVGICDYQPRCPHANYCAAPLDPNTNFIFNGDPLVVDE